MKSTQAYLPIKDIHSDVVILKDNGLSIVLETTAVNFGLLSENEQLAIISAFAALLNSLSFPIQIVIRSKRLDITSYLKLLSTAENLQKNQLLAKLMADYRKFIETIVRENQVLDKKFYIIISISSFEAGLTGNEKDHFQKALTVLLPRRDHIIRQLWRTGLKANQLTTKQLIPLYYDVYNPAFKSKPPVPVPEAPFVPLQKETPVIKQETQSPAQIQPQSTSSQVLKPNSGPQIVSQNPQPIIQQTSPQNQVSAYENPPEQIPKEELKPPQPQKLSVSTPFVVEELHDEYGTP